eukprot:gb/GFBE01067041.1/.p1 GENE.gb/GFBE01067041.1/~~gb/GFBE01067041.1/.p1  ORF type:complete len:416 (+),score=97.67 gb/GFBE01067041.1/:1-1248(+)
MASSAQGSCNESEPLAKAAQKGDYKSIEDGEASSNGIRNSMNYRASILGSWETFNVMFSRTVWGSDKLWGMLRRLYCLSLVVAIVPPLLVHNPADLKASRLTAVSQFLNVVVGLLLGFFLTSSINRWYACVAGFLELLDAIRNLQMQFIALGVPKDQENHILRHAYASAFLLYEQLHYENKKLSRTFCEEKESAAMWEKVAKKPTAFCDGEPLLDEKTIEILKDTRDPPSVLWTWAAAHIGRLAADGWIPAMPTPTYGRVMNLCQSAHAGIRAVRASICVQTPWNYAQCLASLVHINNALNATILGCVLGVVSASTLQSYGIGGYSGNVSTEELENDYESLLVTMILCSLGPIVYQSLLLIGISLAQPFDDADSRIPMDRLLEQLEIDMSDSIHLIARLEDKMGFKPPAFKAQGP